jgi:polysaccharide biosynthesis protein PslH
LKILFVLPRFPWPLEKGDKLRAYHFIRELSERHDIHLFALSDTTVSAQDIAALEPFCKSVTVERISLLNRMLGVLSAFFLRKPFQVGYFYKASAKRKISKLDHTINPDAVFCQLVRVAEYAFPLQRFKILDYQDALSKNMERRSSVSAFPMNCLFRRESRRLIAYENQIFGKFHLKCIISETDRGLIQHPDSEQILVIPNGVDLEYFRQEDTVKDKPFDLVFTGNMSYAPNIQGAIWLAREIMPLVQKKIPEARLLLAGASPSAAVNALAGPSTTVSGWMDDIRDAYRQGKVFIAPMQTGSGLQNKLLEAMAMRLPSITTSLANASVGAIPGEQMLVADTAAELAQHAINLLQNPAFADRMADSGHKMVHEKYRWEAHIKTFELELINAFNHDKSW